MADARIVSDQPAGRPQQVLQLQKVRHAVERAVARLLLEPFGEVPFRRSEEKGRLQASGFEAGRNL
jgi:hypothetical protein